MNNKKQWFDKRSYFEAFLILNYENINQCIENDVLKMSIWPEN